MNKRQITSKQLIIKASADDIFKLACPLETTAPSECVRCLLFAVAIATFFIVFLGVELIHSGQLRQLVRTDDSYYSLFQLGLIYLDHLLNECLAFPTFKLRSPDSFNYLSFV